MKKAFSILFLMISFAAFPQEKRETEKRIDRDEMPEKAMGFYDSQVPKDIRWERFYFEKDGADESYEAKFKFDGHGFSVEFDKTGELQDIEIGLKENEIPEPVLEKIKGQINAENELFNIEKIQGQFLPNGSSKNVFGRALDFKKTTPDRYELVVAVKNNGHKKHYELLFDHEGNFVQKRKIIRESSSSLLF
jgi:hypothetical protein